MNECLSLPLHFMMMLILSVFSHHRSQEKSCTSQVISFSSFVNEYCRKKNHHFHLKKRRKEAEKNKMRQEISVSFFLPSVISTDSLFLCRFLLHVLPAVCVSLFLCISYHSFPSLFPSFFLRVEVPVFSSLTRHKNHAYLLLTFSLVAFLFSS